MNDTKTRRPPICANAGCRNLASSETAYCDACELEWHLFRRDLRPSAGTDAATVRTIRRTATP